MRVSSSAGEPRWVGGGSVSQAGVDRADIHDELEQARGHLSAALSRTRRRPTLLRRSDGTEADMALALFADRLGTPTGVSESGTLERLSGWS